jgi:peroxiredoxin
MTTWLLVLLATAIALVVLAETWLFVHLRRQSIEIDRRSQEMQRALGRRKRIGELREGGAVSFSLPAESILNDFELPNINGRKIKYSSWRGTKLAAIFVRPSCPYSKQVVEAVARQPPSSLTPVFISTGSPEANRAFFADLPSDIPILLQEETELARVWRVMVSPCAYLIDEAGVTIGVLREGAPAILRALGIETDAHSGTDRPQTSELATMINPFPQPPRVGEAVPDLELALLSGRTAQLHSIRPTILLVLDLRCAACRDGLSELAATIRERAVRSRIIVLSLGDDSAAHELAATFGQMVGIAPQADYRIMRRLGMLQTPSAVHFDQFGTVQSEVTVGYAAIQRLIAALAPGNVSAGATA